MDIRYHHRLSLNREGCWDATDDFTPSFLHFSVFSTALWDLANSGPVHFLMLSSHLFLCLPCLLPPFTVPWKMILARPDEWKTYPYHCSLRLFAVVRCSCGLYLQCNAEIEIPRLSVMRTLSLQRFYFSSLPGVCQNEPHWLKFN